MFNSHHNKVNVEHVWHKKQREHGGFAGEDSQILNH